MNKKLRKIMVGVWFIIIINLSLCCGILQLIIKEQKSEKRLSGINEFGLYLYKLLSSKLGFDDMGKINIDPSTVSFFITCLCLGIYLIVSLLLIRYYCKRSIKNLYLCSSIQEVDEMTGIEFECYLYYKFRQRRYQVMTTPVSGDYGADLILKMRRDKIVVQAKRYQSDVGIAAVQEVIGSIAFYGAIQGIVITNSYFTPNAINLAKVNHVILWDRNRLIKEFIAEESSENNELEEEVTIGNCPYCGKYLINRSGKYGSFIGCSGYPKCSYTTSVNEV